MAGRPLILPLARTIHGPIFNSWRPRNCPVPLQKRLPQWLESQIEEDDAKGEVDRLVGDREPVEALDVGSLILAVGSQNPFMLVTYGPPIIVAGRPGPQFAYHPMPSRFQAARARSGLPPAWPYR